MLCILAFIFLSVLAVELLAWRHARAFIVYSEGAKKTDSPEKLGFAAKLAVLFTGIDNPRPRGTRTPADLELTYRDKTVECDNGIILTAWYCPARSNETLAVMFHGNASDKSTLLDEAAALNSLGVSTFLVDFRGSGASSENYTSIGYLEAEDVYNAVRYCQGELPHRRLILYGRSMGAAALLRAVNLGIVQPDGVIVEAVFDRFSGTVANRFRAIGLPSQPFTWLLLFWGGLLLDFNAFSHNPSQYAAALDCPALFMHGGRDQRATVPEAEHVFSAVKAPKRMYIFKNMGHESYCAKEKGLWLHEVSSFLLLIE